MIFHLCNDLQVVSLILDPHYKEVSTELTDYTSSKIQLLRIPANLFALPGDKLNKVREDKIICEE